ncbi:MAG: hypothetical protein QY321_03335 [Patescibacteria group bacterium]|nr:MAG: hypothetical protein QY321_03335 [Patescibacteria group bacterium]
MKIKDQGQFFLKEVFYFLTLGFLMFVLMEMVKPGMVIAYLNLNYWLLVWLIWGIMILSIKKLD